MIDNKCNTCLVVAFFALRLFGLFLFSVVCLFCFGVCGDMME
jgi:hypothetical protein